MTNREIETVEVIACIINGRKQELGDRRTTLIVVNSSIIMQWYEELLKHAKPKELGRIVKYCTGSRFETADNVAELMDYDVV